MATTPFTYSVSEFTTNPWSFEQDVSTYARLGVQAIEVCEFKLDPARMQEQLEMIPQHGLQISSVQPSVRTLFPSQSQPEPGTVPERMALFRQTIERFGRFARHVPFVTNTGIPPDGNVQEVVDTAARQYRELAEYAARHEATIAFEPLNPTIMNVETAIWTVQQAMRLVEAVDRPNFGICLDLWNIWQNADIFEAIRQAGRRIFIVQVSDWRTPRSYADRLIPGQGEIPFPPYLRAIHAAGYRGAYEVEIFSDHVPDSLWTGDLERVITASRKGLERAWQDAFGREDSPV